VKGYPNATISRGKTKQLIEPLMRQFNIPAAEFRTYTVLLENKRRITFIPYAIWPIGANGRWALPMQGHL
jgi:hypothetical protein